MCMLADSTALRLAGALGSTGQGRGVSGRSWTAYETSAQMTSSQASRTASPRTMAMKTCPTRAQCGPRRGPADRKGRMGSGRGRMAATGGSRKVQVFRDPPMHDIVCHNLSTSQDHPVMYIRNARRALSDTMDHNLSNSSRGCSATHARMQTLTRRGSASASWTACPASGAGRS